MKRLISLIVLIFTSFSLYAQNDVTTFLGIPVDGFKPEMIKQLKAKGFVSSIFDADILEGEFNGQDVDVHIVTNNNKVYRIAVFDKNTISESSIKNRFNILCNQFTNNQRYISFLDYTIPAEEDISYEMNIHDKRYEAHFYQDLSDETYKSLAAEVESIIYSKYLPEQLENATEEIKNEVISVTSRLTYEALAKKTVWFTIEEYGGEYYIAMYYDNGYNQANGEDL